MPYNPENDGKNSINRNRFGDFHDAYRFLHVFNSIFRRFVNLTVAFFEEGPKKMYLFSIMSK